MCNEQKIDLTEKIISVEVCDTEKMGYNLSEKDLRYYEHLLIRKCKEEGYPLLNIKDEKAFVERERYIDEIPIDDFRFERTDYRLVNNIKLIN